MKPVTEQDLLKYGKVPVYIAAAYCHLGNVAMADGLQQGRFPFGVAIKNREGGWNYCIPPKRLIAWYNGTDLAEVGCHDN